MIDLDFSVVNHTAGSAAHCLAQLRSWRRGHPGNSFSEFLDLQPIDAVEVLIELATADLINQIASGIPARAEHYITASTMISNRKDCVLDLVDAELCARSDRGETLNRDELNSRFRGFDIEVERLLEVHQLDLEASRSEGGDDPLRADRPDIGEYELIRPLSLTNNCKYWIAQRRKDETPVLLFWYALDEHETASIEAWRLETSLRIVQNIRHRYLSPITDFGLVDGNVYCAYPDNGDFLLFDQPWKVLDEVALVSLLQKILQAIEFALQSGVFLRDLRVGDILFANDETGPRLLDFGLRQWIKQLAETAGDPNRETGFLPLAESVSPLAVEDRLREFGLLMFSIVVGDSDTDEMEQHLREGHLPIRISQIDSRISPQLDAIYLACTHPDAALRYKSLGELAEDLVRIQNGKRLIANRFHRKKWLGKLF